MTATDHPSPPTHGADKALTLALRLAHAENALHALTAGQVDAIVAPDGRAYLLRPAQEHLRKNAARLQAVIESAADVITVVDRSGVILSQSDAVRRVLGYGPHELVGSSIFELIHEDDLERLYSAFFNVIEGFRENATAQFRHRARDGAYHLIEGTAGILRDAASACVVFILRPMTSQGWERPKPVAPHTAAIPQTNEDRGSIVLSHGRRIPLSEFQTGQNISESPRS